MQCIKKQISEVRNIVPIFSSTKISDALLPFGLPNITNQHANEFQKNHRPYNDEGLTGYVLILYIPPFQGFQS